MDGLERDGTEQSGRFPGGYCEVPEEESGHLPGGGGRGARRGRHPRGQRRARGYLYHTAVAPDCRHRGIGSALVQAVLDALAAEGIHKAALVVFSRNRAGNAFWEAQGFTVREDLTYRNRALAEMKRIDT